MSKPVLVILLIFTIATSACSSKEPALTSTQLPASQPATATQTSTLPQSSPIPEESPTAEPDVSVEQTARVPAGLRAVYLRDGNLWSWTETEGGVMLTDTGDISTMRLANDGQWLAFMRGPEVWTVRMDGTDARLLALQNDEGGALWFAPNGSLLAVSTADHIDIFDLINATVATVLIYPAIPNDYYPEVVWTTDSSGFKTVIPPNSEDGQAELMFVFVNGTTASLAKFALAPPSESLPFIAPDGGYVIYVAKLGDGKESLYLMDSSGAARPYGEPVESIRATGWLPDSKNFVYAQEGQERILLGSVTGKPPVELFDHTYHSMRWLDAEHFLAMQDGNLYLGDINGGQTLIAENVSAFDFEK